MATQLSAITLVGTTGQAYADGMRFIQFYFGLPIAMVHPVGDAGAVLLPVGRLHGVRVPRAALRREDAHAREPAVPLRPEHVDRRDHLGARGDPVDHLSLEPDADDPRDRRTDDPLHDARRRPGGHLDRRQADGHRRRRAGVRRGVR